MSKRSKDKPLIVIHKRKEEFSIEAEYPPSDAEYGAPFTIGPFWDLPLSKRQLIYLLTTVIGIEIEEIFQMLAAFRLNPKDNRAEFGYNYRFTITREEK